MFVMVVYTRFMVMDDLLDHIGLEKEGERLDRMGRKSKKKARGIERDLRIVVVKYGLRDDYCNLR